MKVTTEHILSDEATNDLYPTYVMAFDPLLTTAAARHILTAEEFAKEMNDPRIEKYVVRDQAGRAVALTTLTSDLSAIDWINPHFYMARYPEPAARKALFYLGYALVALGSRRTQALVLMAAEINRRLAEVSGVVAFDICGYNIEHVVGRRIGRLFSGSHRIDSLDTQTYFAADYRRSETTVAPSPEPEPVVRERVVPELSVPEPLVPEPLVPAPTVPAPLVPGLVRPVSLADRPELGGDVLGVLASRWPPYMLAGQAGHGADLEELLTARPQDHVLLLDASDQVLGVALSIPLWWDQTVAGLPAGWDDAIDRSVRQAQEGRSPNTTCALSITIAPSAARQNLAVQCLAGLKQVARRAGSRALLAPIRPILKADYPLVEMSSYLTWRTPDDRVFDPWLRLHLREGAELLQVAPRSMTISGSLGDWQEWVGQTFPGSGDFIIAGGLVPLRVDAAAGTAVYVEPNVWMAHHLSDEGPAAVPR